MEAEIVRGVGEGVFGRVQGQQREEITFIPHSGCCEWGRKGARCERSWHGNDNFTIGAWRIALKNMTEEAEMKWALKGHALS